MAYPPNLLGTNGGACRQMALLFVLLFVLFIIDLLVLAFVQFFDRHAPPLAGQVVEHVTQGVVGSCT